MSEVAQTFTEIADKNSDLVWLISKWDKDQLVLVDKGSSSFDDFKSKLSPSEIYFCIFKVYGLDHHEAVTSKRDKIIAITWVPQTVSPLKRNAVLNSKETRSQVFPGVVTEIQADDLDGIDAAEIGKQLLAIGGAHRPTHYEFGQGFEIAVADLI